MKENNILRLALIAEDQSATTVDKYVCKLVESVLFSYDGQKLSAVDLCKLIKDQFELEFDVLEIETAIKKKSKGRILCFEHEYQLAPKVISQLSKQKDPLSLLKLSISKFLNETKSGYDSEELLDNIQKYLYHCFNSSIDNLLNLLQTKNAETITKFDAPAEVVQQINEFIAWDDNEKNKLIYDIISFSYEYCMLTTKKDTLLSKNIFKGKRFFLDTNIIFRMAGINKDERQFVIKSFIKKSKEIGVELYYTSETLSELYRVIDGQIRYIQYLTQGQAPIDAATLQSIDYSNELNDFYVLYYNWCNEPQNNYNDFSSFQKHLISLIRGVLENLNFSDIPNEGSGKKKDIFEEQCSLLFDYKKEKRPQKRNSIESTRTDINNIFYILSLRNAASAPSLWQINDYLVSADQLLTNWSRNQYSGVPIVVIPSTWLSIMLRFSGRSEDDYKAFCLFMSLRQHKEAEDEITINPVSLLNSLAKRTSDKSIKYQIIEEIITNKNEYQFSTKEDYSISIENAFEKILKKSTEEVRETMLSVMSDKEKEHTETINELSSKLEERSTKDEYVLKIASNKAQKKVDWWKKFKFLQTFIPFVTTIFMVGVGIVSLFKLEPIYSFLTGILPGENPTGIVTLPLLSFVSGTLMNVLVIYPLNYLTSDDRKQILIKRYEKHERKYLDD